MESPLAGGGAVTLGKRAFAALLAALLWVPGMRRALGADTSAGPTAPQVKLPPKARFHLFLLAGQSNMAGRGDVEAEDQAPLAGVLALDAAGRWVPAVDPLHWDKPGAGTGLGRSFAVEYLRAHPGVTVGLIPAACGGSPIATWQPGQYFDQTHSHPYDDALARTRLALKSGTLQGILWHQGESDRGAELAERYEAALTELIARFRRELAAPRVPFVIGQIGQFAGAPWDDGGRRVDLAQRNVAAHVPFATFVLADGLTSKPDNLHFDARSLREFGKRYAAAFSELESRSRAAAAPGHDPKKAAPAPVAH
jgi:hypothetical protein